MKKSNAPTALHKGKIKPQQPKFGIGLLIDMPLIKHTLCDQSAELTDRRLLKELDEKDFQGQHDDHYLLWPGYVKQQYQK